MTWYTEWRKIFVKWCNVQYWSCSKYFVKTLHAHTVAVTYIHTYTTLLMRVDQTYMAACATCEISIHSVRWFFFCVVDCGVQCRKLDTFCGRKIRRTQLICRLDFKPQGHSSSNILIIGFRLTTACNWFFPRSITQIHARTHVHGGTFYRLKLISFCK